MTNTGLALPVVRACGFQWEPLLARTGFLVAKHAQSTAPAVSGHNPTRFRHGARQAPNGKQIQRNGTLPSGAAFNAHVVRVAARPFPAHERRHTLVDNGIPFEETLARILAAQHESAPSATHCIRTQNGIVKNESEVHLSFASNPIAKENNRTPPNKTAKGPSTRCLGTRHVFQSTGMAFGHHGWL